MRRDLAAADGECSIKQADLDEHRSLVPIQVLVGDLIALEVHDDGEREFNRRTIPRNPIAAGRCAI